MKIAFAATLLAALGLVADGKRATAATRAARKAARKEARKQRAITRKNHGAVKKSLLKNAIPVNKDGSRRQLNEEFEITADYSIVFNHCVSLTAVSEDVFDEGYMQQLYEQGSIIPQTSYILFNILLTENVYYQRGGEDNLYMIGIDDWMQGIADGTADEMEAALNDDENYCNACQESEEVCNPEEEEEEQGDDGDDADDEADDGDERKLKQRKLRKDFARHVKGRKLDEQEKAVRCADWYVDCDECNNRGCFDEDQDDEDEDEEEYCDEDNYQNCNFDPEDVAGYLEEALCVDTGIEEQDGNGDDVNIMAGLMCNEDGTGVEMALFLDDDCQVYDTTRNFQETMKYTYVYAIMSEASQYVVKPFKDDSSIDCQFCEYMALEAEDEDGNQDDEEEEDEGEVSEICRGLQDALDLETCNGAEADDDNNDDDNAWQNYDFNVQDPDDEDEACLFLKNALAEGSTFEQFHTYRSDDGNGGGSGNFFDYSSSKSKEDGSGKAGKIFGIIIAVVVVVVAGVLIGQSFAKKGDSKKVPLVGNKAGAMA